MANDLVLLRVRLLRPGACLPSRASAGASGFDVRACLPDGEAIEVGRDPVRIPTGIAIEAPDDSDVQLRPRSGLSAQGVMATFGTIDADYRGELFVTLYTVGTRPPHVIRSGDRVAQLVVARLADVQWETAESLSESQRGESGHGSTGR